MPLFTKRSEDLVSKVGPQALRAVGTKKVGVRATFWPRKFGVRLSRGFGRCVARWFGLMGPVLRSARVGMSWMLPVLFLWACDTRHYEPKEPELPDATSQGTQGGAEDNNDDDGGQDEDSSKDGSPDDSPDGSPDDSEDESEDDNSDGSKEVSGSENAESASNESSDGRSRSRATASSAMNEGEPSRGHALRSRDVAE